MEKRLKKPDFFIVGAPKCGTTAMNYYLKQHPEIFMPEVKEIHYFGTDLDFKFRSERINLNQYISLFSKAHNEKRIGETSVWYLYSKSAAKEIKAFAPSASIIIMLRNPVDLLYSLHSQFVYEGNEDILDFKEALNAEEYRKQGKKIPPTAYLPKTLFYREVVKFSGQITRYLNLFGRKNIHFIIFDDLLREPREVYRAILHFLGVKEDFEIDFNTINPNKKLISPKLQRLLIRPPQSFIHYGKYLKIPKNLQNWIIKMLTKMNTIYKKRPPMDHILRIQLQKEFSHEVEQLSELVGRDLTHWVKN
ncbi:MAG: sulfotransferase [Nitrospirae bacterium]|nr:sulfotransferase [Nitrospirota bacterium]